jgi:FkbM family methyltransferase
VTAITKSVTYAQNGEDILLNRFFAWQADGFYIDVGANDPVENSVTRFFSQRGWHGINIEPITALYDRLCADRPRDINLNVGVAEVAGTLTFYEAVDLNGILSTFDAAQAEEHGRSGRSFQTCQVPVVTLSEVCERHVRRPIDFLSIDVEGYERKVLEGFDLRRWRPRVLLLEANVPCTARPSHPEWEDLVLANDYHFATYDGLNRYYVRAEDLDLLPRLSTPTYDRPLYIHREEHERLVELEQQGQELRAVLARWKDRNRYLESALAATRDALRDSIASLNQLRRVG